MFKVISNHQITNSHKMVVYLPVLEPRVLIIIQLPQMAVYIQRHMDLKLEMLYLMENRLTHIRLKIKSAFNHLVT